jgi:hypothetical protein
MNCNIFLVITVVVNKSCALSCNAAAAVRYFSSLVQSVAVHVTQRIKVIQCFEMDIKQFAKRRKLSQQNSINKCVMHASSKPHSVIHDEVWSSY